MKKMVSCALMASFVAGSAYSYDVMKRYTLLEDKIKTEDMLRPFGHDFLIDINVTANKNLKDFYNDVKDMSKTSGSTDAQKIAAASQVLEKYNNTEQTLRGNVNLGIPLFSFNAFGIKFSPDLRLSAMVGANLAIQSETLTAATISSLLGQDTPDFIKAAVNSAGMLSQPAGTDIVQYAITSGAITGANAVVAQQYVGKYYWPGSQAPMVYGYAKLDAKGGLLVNMKKDENWFGHVNLYAMNRTDYKVKVTAATFVKDQSITDQVKNKNSQTLLETDYKVGYAWDRYTVAGSLEEVKLATLSDNLATGGDLIYKTPALMRLHADAKFKFSALSLTPFAGVHKRTGYDFTDGIYGGADWGVYVWGDRLGLQLRTMMDPEHFTLSPRMKLWLMQLEYSLKKPITSTVDGMKVSTLHSLDFRLFF